MCLAQLHSGFICRTQDLMDCVNVVALCFSMHAGVKTSGNVVTAVALCLSMHVELKTSVFSTCWCQNLCGVVTTVAPCFSVHVDVKTSVNFVTEELKTLVDVFITVELCFHM